MEKEYIQLPPLPADMEWDAVKVIWEFAKLSDEEKISVHADMCRIMGGKDEVPEMPENYRKIEPEEIEGYVESLRSLMASLITEASDVAAWVFARKYIDGFSLEQMLEELPNAEKFIRVMDMMFEQNIGIKEPEDAEPEDEN